MPRIYSMLLAGLMFDISCWGKPPRGTVHALQLLMLMSFGQSDCYVIYACNLTAAYSSLYATHWTATHSSCRNVVVVSGHMVTTSVW